MDFIFIAAAALLADAAEAVKKNITSFINIFVIIVVVHSVFLWSTGNLGNL